MTVVVVTTLFLYVAVPATSSFFEGGHDLGLSECGHDLGLLCSDGHDLDVSLAVTITLTFSEGGQDTFLL